jgi:arylsulfatase A-like enzyme
VLVLGTLATVCADDSFDAFEQLRRGEASARFPQQIATVEAFRARRIASTSVVPNYLAFPVVIPPHAVLRVGFTVLPTYFGADVTAQAEPVRFTITLLPAGTAPVILFQRVVDVRARPGDRRWHDVRLDLAAYAGTTGTLRLRHEVDGAPTAFGHAQAAWARPVVYDAAAEGTRTNLLLVTIDALRADHVSAYGYRRPTTPRLDALAHAGVRFTTAFANAPMTKPSLPQMLTSRYFPDSTHPTLATLLFAGGVPLTKAIINNDNLALWLTFEGRDAFDSMSAAPLRAEHLTDAALRWLDRRHGDRFALYLHYLDTHTPYRVPADHAGRFVDASYTGPIGLRFSDPEGARAGKYTGAERTRIVDLYDGAVRYVDGEIGRLLDGLDARGLRDTTLVVITADHGEEFWDHGAFFHGQSLYDEQLHVPLILRLPRDEAAGTVVPQLVRLVDVVPSIAEVLGLRVPEDLVGESLLPLVHEGAADRDAVVFARAANVEFPYRFGLRTPTHKLIVSVADGAEELYDLRTDPGERTNIGSRDATVLAGLRDRLAGFRHELRTRGFQIRAAGDGAPHTIDVTVQGHDAPLVDPDRIDLAASDRVTLEDNGRTLRWQGTVGSAPKGIRFARGYAQDPTHDRLTFHVMIDGTDPSPRAIRLGGGSDGPAARFELPANGPELVAEAAPPLARANAPVAVTIWRSPDTTHVAPMGGVPTPEERRRLRALGYVE